MYRRPKIGFWPPAEPDSNPIRGIDKQIADLVDCAPLNTDTHGITLDSTAGTGSNLPRLRWLTPPEGLLPCHGLVILSGAPDSSDSIATEAAPTNPDPASFQLDLLSYVPIVRTEQLLDPDQREAFFECVLGVERVEHLFKTDWRISELVAFNARERFRVIVHDPKKHTLMGRIVAKAKDHVRAELVPEFTELYLGALARPVTRRKHESLFKHVMELLGDRLDEQKQEALRAAIQGYRSGEMKRAVPMEQLQKHILELGVRGLETQSYLFPPELEAACIGLTPQLRTPAVPLR